MDTVERMRKVWATVFGLEDVPADADFLLLGGDSLAATELVIHIETSFGVVVDPVEIFETPNLREFAGRVAKLLGVYEEAVL